MQKFKIRKIIIITFLFGVMITIPAGYLNHFILETFENQNEVNNEDQNQLLKIVKDISSKGFLRSNYKKKLVDLSDITINLKGKK